MAGSKSPHGLPTDSMSKLLTRLCMALAPPLPSPPPGAAACCNGNGDSEPPPKPLGCGMLTTPPPKPLLLPIVPLLPGAACRAQVTSERVLSFDVCKIMLRFAYTPHCNTPIWGCRTNERIDATLETTSHLLLCSTLQVPDLESVGGASANDLSRQHRIQQRVQRIAAAAQVALRLRLRLRRRLLRRLWLLEWLRQRACAAVRALIQQLHCVQAGGTMSQSRESHQPGPSCTRNQNAWQHGSYNVSVLCAHAHLLRRCLQRRERALVALPHPCDYCRVQAAAAARAAGGSPQCRQGSGHITLVAADLLAHDCL